MSKAQTPLFWLSIFTPWFFATGCADPNQQKLEEMAGTLHSLASECYLDVDYMGFLESKNCSEYPRRYQKFTTERDRFAPKLVSLDETQKETQRQRNSLPDLKILNSVNEANLLYASAVFDSGIARSEKIKRFYDPTFVDNLRQQSGAKFKVRPPTPPTM